MNSHRQSQKPHSFLNKAKTGRHKLPTKLLDEAYLSAVTQEAAVRKRKARLRRFSLGGVVMVLALLALLLANRQNLTDWWRLRHYNPPATVAQLATQDTMTVYARKVFYVNSPAILTGKSFYSPCPDYGREQTIVLGCYHGGQNGIFVLSVNDPLLDGVKQVTAAHEMLHAAYDRLSSSERRTVDAQLLDYYNHQLHDKRILATIAAYKKTEPNDVLNEMHSVFGTEVGRLPTPLEQYYTRYFTDRQQVVSLAARYQGEFTSRQTTIAQDDAELALLKNQINQQEAQLKSQLASINIQQTQLVGLRRSNVAAYNAGVPAYNFQVDNYNVAAGSLQALIDRFNQLASARNAVASEEDQLVQELSSTPAQISK